MKNCNKSKETISLICALFFFIDTNLLLNREEIYFIHLIKFALKFFQLSLSGLPSKAMVCAASSSRSDLRKNDAASPNSFMSKRDMVATPRRPPAETDEVKNPFGKKTELCVRVSCSLYVKAVSVTSAFHYWRKQDVATGTLPVRKERKSTITE